MCGLAVCGDRNRLDASTGSDGGAGRAFGGPRLRQNRLAGHALLEQQLGRLHPRIGVEPRHEHVVADHVGERHERHALMVREEGADDLRPRRCAGRRRRRRSALRGR